jgi:hypothetical protein
MCIGFMQLLDTEDFGERFLGARCGFRLVAGGVAPQS